MNCFYILQVSSGAPLIPCIFKCSISWVFRVYFYTKYVNTEYFYFNAIHKSDLYVYVGDLPCERDKERKV